MPRRIRIIDLEPETNGHLTISDQDIDHTIGPGGELEITVTETVEIAEVSETDETQ